GVMSPYSASGGASALYGIAWIIVSAARDCSRLSPAGILTRSLPIGRVTRSAVRQRTSIARAETAPRSRPAPGTAPADLGDGFSVVVNDLNIVLPYDRGCVAQIG